MMEYLVELSEKTHVKFSRDKHGFSILKIKLISDPNTSEEASDEVSIPFEQFYAMAHALDILKELNTVFIVHNERSIIAAFSNKDIAERYQQIHMDYDIKEHHLFHSYDVDYQRDLRERHKKLREEMTALEKEMLA